MVNKFFFIPSFFTFLNFFWGFFSIVEAVEGNLHRAAWFIILAVLCDGMDGKLARWTGSETPFGFELDSLGDMISSGLAPAVLIYIGTLHRVGFAGALICFIYLFAGGYRLARFNVLKAGDRSEGYVGLPIPVAAMTVASLWIFRSPFGDPISVGLLITLMVSLAVLMISTIHYSWPRLAFHVSWIKTVQSVVLLLATGLMAVFPERSLFPLFCLYSLLGIRAWIADLLKGKVRLAGFFLSG